MDFIPFGRFNPEAGFTLSDTDIEELSQKDISTVGQHMGRQLPVLNAIVKEPMTSLNRQTTSSATTTTTESEKPVIAKIVEERRPWYTYW